MMSSPQKSIRSGSPWEEPERQLAAKNERGPFPSLEKTAPEEQILPRIFTSCCLLQTMKQIAVKRRPVKSLTDPRRERCPRCNSRDCERVTALDEDKQILSFLMCRQCAWSGYPEAAQLEFPWLNEA
jgi:hypothetical protein